MFNILEGVQPSHDRLDISRIFFYLLFKRPIYNWIWFKGQHLEGMRELDSLVTFDMRDVILCASMLHIYAHKLCATVGKIHL